MRFVMLALLAVGAASPRPGIVNPGTGANPAFIPVGTWDFQAHVCPTSDPTGRERYIDVRDFGAKCDGKTDDSFVFTVAEQFGKVCGMPVRYCSTAPNS